MPRPTSKAQLLEQARQNYAKLQAEIKELSSDDLIEPGIVGDWSIKDVLAHLMVWQQMTLNWYRMGKAGETPVTPSEKYTWREIPALNHEIYETHRDYPLADIQRGLDESHHETLHLIETMSDDELFTPKVYRKCVSAPSFSYGGVDALSLSSLKLYNDRNGKQNTLQDIENQKNV